MIGTQTVSPAFRSGLDRSPSSERIAGGTFEDRGVYPRFLGGRGPEAPNASRGSSSLARDAIVSRIALAAGRPRADIAKWGHVLRVDAFLDTAGAVDADAVDRYAALLTPAPAPPPAVFDPVAAALARGRLHPPTIDHEGASR